jgi:predicted DNA-binding transcriptional regulator AlpA
MEGADMPTRPNLAEVESWPATVNVDRAAAAVGVSRSAAYVAIRDGSFPARTIRVGERVVVVTSSLVALLRGGSEG